MRKMISLNIVTILIVLGLFYFVCFLLLNENRLNISISSIIANSHHLKLKKHLLVLGLLPIYIAAIVFGAAMLGVYIGSWVQQTLTRLFSKTEHRVKKSQLSDSPSCM